MRHAFFTLVFIHATAFAIAQKKPLDYTASHNWPVLKPIAISNNGEYAVYSMSSPGAETIWTVQALNHSWKKELPGIRNIAFTPDGRRLIFLNKNDSLGILDLTMDTTKYVASVVSFKQPEDSDGRWISFLLRPKKDLCLLDLFTGATKIYSTVNDYVFDKKGKTLLFQSDAKADASSLKSVVWVNITDDVSSSTIAHVSSPKVFIFDDAGGQLAFFSNQSINGMIGSIKYYRIGMDSALTLVDSNTSGMAGMVVTRGRQISGAVMAFSGKEDKMFFRIAVPEASKTADTNSDPVQVIIKSPQSEFRNRILEDYVATVHLPNNPHKVIPIENDQSISAALDKNGEYLLTESFIKKINVYEPYDGFRRDLRLTSTKDGSGRYIKSNAMSWGAKFSLSGKYVIWYNPENGQWETYRISDGHFSVITKGIPLDSLDEKPNGLWVEQGLAGWLENDKTVLIYDKYDIWMVDPDGVQDPVNLTSGWGRRNNIRLRYMDFNRNDPKSIRLNDTLILSAFNIVTKENGFFALRTGKPHGLQKLIMGNDIFYYPYRFESPTINGMCETPFPLKARLANRWIVQRMNVNKYPNLYYTSDFEHFEPLTNLQPQKNYLWYASELIHFPLPNGHTSEGILYKPENFDPSHRYPLIFYYYERNADELYSFIHPDLSNGVLNIPWYVSNGYLVFVPDIINYKLGEPGECAFQAVNSAANVLSRMPWVDAQRMGLQGHSYGGWETNYIVTRTDRFAAAATAAGVSDIVSSYGQGFSNLENSYFFEVGQGRMAASFWINPERYILNSPVFKANKVNTPILILHNDGDQDVAIDQGIEWFNNLSRLRKKVWFLSYTEEGHVLESEKNQLDYSIRLAQFFDHYLKGKPSPKWMAEGTDGHRN